MQIVAATDWGMWTAIGTFIAAGAAIGLAIVTGWLVLTTRRMVRTAIAEIGLERRRIEQSTTPSVFPAPTGHWGWDGGETGRAWRRHLPATNGGPGVATNVIARLRWGPPSGLFAETVPTSLGAGEYRELMIKWGATPLVDWGPQVDGELYYNDIAGALWKTEFRIYAEQDRQLVEVRGTRMIKDADGTVVA